jgi:hypothetical protein
MKKYLLMIIILLSSHISFSKEISNYEIRTAPITLIARWGTLDFSFNIDNQWAIGPSVIIYAAPKIGNMFAPSYNGTAVGAHAYYYFNSFLDDSWYWGNHAYYESYESYPHDFNGHYEFKGFKFNTKVGYQVTTPLGINMLFGIGAEARKYDQKNIDDSNGGNSPKFKDYQPVIGFVEVKLGYKF